MKLLKYLGVFLVITLISFLALFFYIKQAFPPEKIKEITLTQLKKSFPKAKFKINSIETSLFLSLNVEVAGFEVTGSEGKTLFKVEKVKSNIPLLSLFQDSKAIDLSFYDPVINFRTNGEKNNFTETFVAKSDIKNKVSSDKVSSDKVSSDKVSNESISDKNISNKSEGKLLLPFLKNINVNISLFKMNFLLLEKGKKSKSVIIEKLSFRNIGLNKNIEIDLLSKIYLKQKNNERNKDFLDFNLGGKISIKELLNQGLVKADLKFSVLNFKNNLFRLSPLEGGINLILSKEGNINGNLFSKLNNEDFLESDFKIAKKSIDLNISKLKVNINKIFKRKDYGDLKFEEGLVFLNGKLKIIKSNVYPDIKINNTAKIIYKRDKLYNFKINADIILNRRGLKLSSKINGLDGSVKLRSIADFDINRFIKNTKKIPFIKTNLVVDGINIPNSFIITKEKKLNNEIKNSNENKDSKVSKGSKESKKSKVSKASKEGKESNESRVIKSEKDVIVKSSKGFDLPYIPPNEIRISVKKTRLLGNPLNSEVYFLAKKNSVAIKKFNLKYGKGKLKLSTLIKKKNNSLNSKYKVILEKFDAQDFKALIPKNVGKIKGNLSIKSNGSFALKTNSPFQESDIKKIFFESQGSNLEIEKLNINSYAQSYIERLDLLNKMSRKKYTFSSGLDNLKVKAYYSKSRLKIVNFLIFGDNKSFEINGKGYMYPFNGKKRGAINLNFIDNKTGFGRVLKNQIGSNSVPILLKTNKLAVSPNYSYTTKKISSKFVRHQGQKQINRQKKKIENEVKKKAEKEIKKILNKKKLKNLFKF